MAKIGLIGGGDIIAIHEVASALAEVGAEIILVNTKSETNESTPLGHRAYTITDIPAMPELKTVLKEEKKNYITGKRLPPKKRRK